LVVEEMMKKAIFRTTTIVMALMLTMVLCAPAEYAVAQVNPSQPAAGASAAQVQQPQEGGVNWPGTGYGVGALFANVLYVPAKLVYAILGGLVGGGTYLMTAGNKQAADTVWRSAFGGDYVVTPQMLAGEQPLNFSGPTETPPENIAPVNSTSSSGNMSNMNSSSVAPIAPIPSPGTSASASPAGGQPLDHGAGPAGRSNIE
jgi:hypothetical protein